MTESSSFEPLRRFVQLTAEKRELKATLKKMEEDLRTLEDEVGEMLIGEGVQNLAIDGHTLYLRREVYPKLLVGDGPREEASERLVKALEEANLEWCITYSPQRLRGLIMEHGEEALPASVRECLDLSEHMRVGVRRA